MAPSPARGPRKLATGIAGFDAIAAGGVPCGRSTLLTGTAGSGKTVFALQFLHGGARAFAQNGVLVTFEERPRNLLDNVAAFGWDFDALIAAEKIAVVDATLDPGETVVAAGPWTMEALLARIERAVTAVGAQRVVLDAVGALVPELADPPTIRRELNRILAALARLSVTTLITMERTQEDGAVGRFGVEEFVADNVLVLRNRLERERRRRTVEILKFRGTPHRTGEFAFTIGAEGIAVLTPPDAAPAAPLADHRLSIGVGALDRMCGGGLHRGTAALVSGATGTGKTLLAIQFVRAALAEGESALLILTEESREALLRSAAAWGVDLAAAEADGALRIRARTPETMGLEDHLIHLVHDLDDARPHRVCVDSLSAFERDATPGAFRGFLVALAGHLKAAGCTTLLTNTTAMHPGVSSATESHAATLADAIVLLRYVELLGEMRRGLTVLKMRGTGHEGSIREYTIDGGGLHIGAPFRGVHGVVSGLPTYSTSSEAERLDGMFDPRTRFAT